MVRKLSPMRFVCLALLLDFPCCCYVSVVHGPVSNEYLITPKFQLPAIRCTQL